MTILNYIIGKLFILITTKLFQKGKLKMLNQKEKKRES